MIYRIRITENALTQLAAISDLRVRRKIAERIDKLADEADKQGKPLLGELAGHRSVRAVGQRYRIIYRVEEDQIFVEVVCLGLRKETDKKTDVYALAERLHKAGLL